MTRLYPAYTRDLLSFLNFTQLQKSRLVSHSVNATIMGNRVSISARRRLTELSIFVGRAENFYLPPQIGEDGYVKTLNGRAWKRIQAKWDCCREELEESAQGLVGEHIIPSHPADHFVDFFVTVQRPRDGILFWARNEMTAETAFGILHLLEHLRHTYVSKHYFTGFRGKALNPSILRLLSGGGDSRGTYKLHVGLYWTNLERNTIDELMAGLAHLKAGELSNSESGALELLLAFALRGKPYCKRIMRGCQRNNAFNAVLQYFRTSVTRIGRNVASELVLRRYLHDDFWPADLPPLGDMEQYEQFDHQGSGEVGYRLVGGMDNIHSGERFDVVVICEKTKRREGGVENMREMRLLFR